MRLRSRCGVAGSFQIAGKSVTSLRMRVFWVDGQVAAAGQVGVVAGALNDGGP
jgi:hypothetical protein